MPFMVLEYLKGKTLREWLTERKERFHGEQGIGRGLSTRKREKYHWVGTNNARKTATPANVVSFSATGRRWPRLISPRSAMNTPSAPTASTGTRKRISSN